MTTTHTDLDAELDDSGAGLTMFLIFAGGVLLVTGAVAVVALAGGWWILGLGFAIHVVMTVVVMVTIARVLGDRTDVPAEREAEDSRPQPGPSVPARPVAAL